MRRAIWLTGAIAALAALSGCGGGDDSLPETPVLTPTAETPTSLSKDDFISQADGICAEVNAAVGTVDSSTSTDPSSAIGQKADLYSGMLERIKSLGQPDDDTGLSEFYSAGDDLVRAENDAKLAAERGDDAALASAESDASSALASFQSAAGAYGFQDCGQGPSAPSTTTTTPSTTTPVTPVPTTTTPVTPPPAAPAAPTPVPPSGGATGGGSTGGGTTGGGTSGGGSTGGGSSSGGIGPG